MKNIKKLLSIVMMLAMVLSLGAQAFAVDITVNEAVNETTGAEYTAWKLLNLTTTPEPVKDKAGKDIGFAYTVNDDFRDLLKEVTEQDTDKEIIEYIQDLGKGDHMSLDAFTKAMYEGIKGDAKLEGLGKTSTANKFTGVDQGYYLIVETTIGHVGEGEDRMEGVATRLILDTAGREALEVTTKEDKPSIDKKVKDFNDTTEAEREDWKVSGDWDIGDHVPFQITATVENSDTYNLYEKYRTVLHDTQSEGLTFLPETLKLTVNGVDYNYDADSKTFKSAAGAALSGVSLNYNDGTKYTDGCTFEIVIEDTKALGVTAGGTVVAEYESVLNEHANIGPTGNPNEVKLEFSNDYVNGGTGTTPKVGVIVFTFKADVNKVDPDSKPLTGAGFTLLKKYANLPEGYEDSDAISYSYGNLKKAAEATADEDKLPKLFKTDDGEYWLALGAKVAVSGSEFSFNGVDDGTYKLVETTVPDGYNKAEDIDFTVTVTHDGKTVTSMTTDNAGVKVIGDAGTYAGVETTVINESGLELPETGGIGTTIFYIAGAVLVAGAVILLVTKKRAGDASK